MSKERIKNLVLLGLPFVVAIGLTAVLQYTVLTNPVAVQKWLESFGAWFILAYVFIQALTIIIAPLGGLFAQLAVISILGPLQGSILIYLVSTPIYCVNFLLARKFGRPLVSKVIGKQGLAKLDHLSEDAGVGTLVVLKVFQGGYFDYVSYATGLTDISFKEFLWINFLGGIPYSIISYFIFLRSRNLITSVVILQILAGVLIAISFAINHYHHKHK